jgi:hypothetical protein
MNKTRRDRLIVAGEPPGEPNGGHEQAVPAIGLD